MDRALKRKRGGLRAYASRSPERPCKCGGEHALEPAAVDEAPRQLRLHLARLHKAPRAILSA